MPYKKRYNSYKRKCPTPMFGKADKYVGTLAYGMAKKALGMLNVEYKFHDIQLTAQVISTTAFISQLSNIGQGDSGTLRDGDQIKAVRINVKGQVVIHPSATRTTTRIMLIQDTQTNGAIFTSANILADITTNDAINSMLNLDNKFRFRVLYDKRITMSITSDQIKFFQINKVLNLRLRYSGTSGDIDDLSSNSLALLFISSEATNTPNITMFSRLRFVDN